MNNQDLINAVEREMQDYQEYRNAQTDANQKRATWKKSLEYLHILQMER
jgi:hypothetical protein